MQDPRAVFNYLDRLFEGLFGHDNWHKFLKRDLQDLLTLIAYAVVLQVGTLALDALLSPSSLKKLIFDIVHYALSVQDKNFNKLNLKINS